ncbi:MAG: N-acetylmuramoyl-L-alanine amidase [Bacteroidales bacterium]|nr:N-acetylmuramoyl-L-alanine amidase [Bacteroidales bacterium]
MKSLRITFLVLALVACPVFAQQKSSPKVKTIVIDPGHGGDKPGAMGHRSKEKDLVLSVAMKFGKLVSDNYPDVNILYTRTTDVDVTLSERARIANRAKADLFISVHANSYPGLAPTGVETFVMGLSQSKRNMEVAKTENADILLEDGYKDNADYKGFDPNSPESYVQFAMFQNAFIDRSLNFAGFLQKQYSKNISTVNRGVKQAELFVLYKTTCPSVLTEIGFISNPDEELYMMSDAGQGTIAVCLLKAFAEYKAQLEGTTVPANFVIDLPGYGKNAPSKAELAEQKRIADSVFLAQKAADSLAAAQAAADSLAAKLAEQAREAEEDAAARHKDATTEKPEVTYRVQFLRSEKPLEPDDKKFRGVTGYDVYQADGYYCYTYGQCASTKEALRPQSEIRKRGFKDAFVIAFYQGHRISIQQAREMKED